MSNLLDNLQSVADDTMRETLDSYLRTRAHALGLPLSEVCRRAGISRQTLYSLSQIPAKLPTMQTVVALASVLGVHPLRLLHLVFDELPITPKVKQHGRTGDQSAFVGESIPDGSRVSFRERFTKTWEVQNIGRVAWEGRFLQCMDDEIVVFNVRTGETLAVSEGLVPEATRIAVPRTVPGAIARLSVTFTAPARPCTCVSYWKSVFEDGSLCFPEAKGLSVLVRVNAPTTAAVRT